MRALTGYPLWFGLIAAGLKPDENRDRRVVRREDYGTPFAIHNGAQQRPKEHAETWLRIKQIAPDLVDGWSLDDPAAWPEWYRLSRIAGAVIAVATIERRAVIHDGWLYDADTYDKVRPVAERRFALGPVVYMLRDVRALATPVPCRGALGFWTLTADVKCAVMAQIASAA